MNTRIQFPSLFKHALVAVAALGSTHLQAQFALNADCADAIEISPSIFGEPAWETYELGSFIIDAERPSDAHTGIWFDFVAASANDVILAQDPAGNFDAVIEVFDACDGVSLGYFNNYGDGAIERALTGGLTAGQSYLFRVSSDAPLFDEIASDIRIQVKTFEDGGIQAPYCGVMDYQLINTIYAERDDLGQLYSNAIVPVQHYSFKFVDEDSNAAAFEMHPDGAPYLTLGNVDELEYGHTYQVSARHTVRTSVNGEIVELWSPYGSSCAIGLQSVVTPTQLTPALCDAGEDVDLSDLLQALPVSGADGYRFTLTGGGSTFVKVLGTYGTFLYTIPGLQYGETYDVTVAVLVGDMWSAEGPACTISMASQPPSTQVTAASCDGNYALPSSEFILADVVAGATQYEFLLRNETTQEDFSEVRPGVALFFNQSANTLTPGVYRAAVRAFAGGQWGDYAQTCLFTLGDVIVDDITETGNGGDLNQSNAKSIEHNTVDMTLYPNPNNGEEIAVSLSGFSGKEALAIVRLIDMMGKEIYQESLPVKGKQSALIIQPEGLGAGVYNMTIQLDGQYVSQTLIVE